MFGSGMELPALLLLTLTDEAFSLIGVSLAFNIVFVAVLFMVAYASQSSKANAFAKEELYSLVFTFFIILFWFSSDAFLNGLINGLITITNPSFGATGQTASYSSGFSISHVLLSQAVINLMVSKMWLTYKTLWMFEFLVGFFSTLGFPVLNPLIGPIVFSISVSPYSGLSVISDAATTLLDVLAMNLGIMWMQEFLLRLATRAGPLIFLPLGLIMRAFPFTRSTGSSIISIAFVMYFVYPFAIILMGMTIFDFYKPVDMAVIPLTTVSMNTNEVTQTFNSLLNPSNDVKNIYTHKGVINTQAEEKCSGNIIYKYLICPFIKIVKPVLNVLKSIFLILFQILILPFKLIGGFFFGFGDIFLPTGMAGAVYIYLTYQLINVSQFVVVVLVSFIIELIVVMTSYRAVAQIFGGELELPGISKLV